MSLLSTACGCIKQQAKISHCPSFIMFGVFRFLNAVLAITLLSPAIFAAESDEGIVDIANSFDMITANKIEELKKVYIKTIKEAEILEAFRLSVAKELRKLNAQLLANSLCVSGSQDVIINLRFSNYVFLEGYDQQLANGIVRDALKEAVNCKTPTQVAGALMSLYLEGSFESFEALLSALVELFRTAHGMPAAKRGKDFYRKFAFNLQKLKQNQNFKDISAALKQDIDEVINQLPNNLQYLFFHSYFCLMNDKYQEYMYTSINPNTLDSESRYIWAWHETLSIDDSGHMKAAIFESNKAAASGFVAQLWGVKFNLPFYMKPDSKLVAAWEKKSEPENCNWNIDFVDDDRVVFTHGDYVVCSTEDKHDSERRQVRGYKGDKYTAESKECQWLLGTCSRK
ncbi:uncharacterized protein LOC106086661 [Stomoxys calcitrans]|uniref:uncharacterized protein LOC106086661 n=1 Tax=Stomoxys calcitrans TaxID=35570 RepID=UPI0027E36A71|nr:uncharacterized protein LOC106086661 [Stomoxys calcitrans]